MRYSDLKEKHIYLVDFDPVRQCEFDRVHLALVIKKSNDRRTATVVPLTTSSNGENRNKVNVGKISSLPSNLRNNDTYVVYNQVRTVNANRFRPLFDNNVIVDCPVDTALFNKIIGICSDELISNLEFDDQIDYYYGKYVELTVKKLVDLAYEIKRTVEKTPINIELVKELALLIKTSSENIDYDNLISESDRKRGIVEIINKSIAGTITDELLEKSQKTDS